MKLVTANQCEYCGKLYSKKSSCRSHEYICYYNPRTKSCASCAFLKLENTPYQRGRFLIYQACLVNENITGSRLKTQCSKYLEKKYQSDEDIMQEAIRNFDSEKAFFNTMILRQKILAK